MSRQLPEYLSNFCYTKYGCDDTDTYAKEWLAKWEKYARYHCFQLEKCPNTDRLHYQGYIELKRQQKTRTLNNFDAMHKEVAKGTWEENMAYCSKEETRVGGPWLNGGKAKGRGKAAQKVVRSKRSEISAAALSAPTISEAMTIIREGLPFEYLIHGDVIERNLSKVIKAPSARPKYPIESFNIPRHDFQLGSERPQCLLLWGPKLMGKTYFALAHFSRPYFVTDLDDLRGIPPGTDGLVFDEITTYHMPISYVKNLVDMCFTRSLRCRYANARIPEGLPKIFCSNDENPFYNENSMGYTIFNAEAVDSRVTKIEIFAKCYNDENSSNSDESIGDHFNV